MDPIFEVFMVNQPSVKIKLAIIIIFIAECLRVHESWNPQKFLTIYTVYSFMHGRRRHPEHSKRPTFTKLVQTLSQPEEVLLKWAPEDSNIHYQVKETNVYCK